MPPKRILHCIGYASGIAAEDASCCMGPLMIQAAFFAAQGNKQSLAFEWRNMLYTAQSEIGLAALPNVANINRQLAREVCECTAQGEPFLVVGGDHASAIGTWSGAAHALAASGKLGLIWIDARMDSHTPQTSTMQNLHQMSLTALLGKGAPELIHLMHSAPKLQPEQVCIVGVREFAPQEVELLQQLGVRVFYMEEVNQRGLEAVMQDALQIAKNDTVGYGVSLDIHAVDPTDAPGVSSVIPDGISGQTLCHAFRQLRDDPKLLGLEIAEFNPRFDQDLKTEKLIQQMVAEIFAA